MLHRRLPCLSFCLLFALVFCLLTAAVTPTAAQDRDRVCRKIDQDIRRIEARMRRPYTAAQGVRFDERLRALKRQRYKHCR